MRFLRAYKMPHNNSLLSIDVLRRTKSISHFATTFSIILKLESEASVALPVGEKSTIPIHFLNLSQKSTISLNSCHENRNATPCLDGQGGGTAAATHHRAGRGKKMSPLASNENGWLQPAAAAMERGLLYWTPADHLPECTTTTRNPPIPHTNLDELRSLLEHKPNNIQNIRTQSIEKPMKRVEQISQRNYFPLRRRTTEPMRNTHTTRNALTHRGSQSQSSKQIRDENVEIVARGGGSFWGLWCARITQFDRCGAKLCRFFAPFLGGRNAALKRK